MQMSGKYRIEAPREAVWAALNDPEVLKQAIPGCEEIEKVSDTELAAKVKIKVGPVSAKFSGKVTLSDLDPPKGYTISGEGKGGPAGFAKGGAKVRLEEDGAATILHDDVEARVGATLPQLGSPSIHATATQRATARCPRRPRARGRPAPGGAAEIWAIRLDAGTGGVGGGPAREEAAESPVAAEEAAPGCAGRPLYWALGVVAIVLVLLAIFGLD